MDLQRWFNSRLPQTLVLAQVLLYLNALIAILAIIESHGLGVPRGTIALVFSVVWVLLLGGEVFGGHGIANSRKVGYRVGVVCALAPAVEQLVILVLYGILSIGIFSLLFEAALIAALLHPQSREYQRIWFK